MAIHQVAPESYEQQLDHKLALLKRQFATLCLPEIDVYTSPSSHYRQRAEFKIWQENGRANYAMYEPGEYKKPYVISDFLVGSERINQLMPALLDAVNSNETLRKRLFQVEFLTTKSGEALITLIYHRPLDDEWQGLAQQLKAQLKVDIIGRSRKQKLLLDRDFVIEKLQVDGSELIYKQVEGSFTQPNAHVCEKMLSWANKHTHNAKGDLLELYCGNGNFTVPLSRHFSKVLATEISKTSVEAAKFNFAQNGIENVEIARMSSEEFTQAMDHVRPFRRLSHIDLSSYQFSSIFVDPPRAGLDDDTLSLSQRFDNIIYVSCNPDTLFDNLTKLSATHLIEHFAVFDQFPYTHHLECGVILRRR
ncbi:tRNA (uridine(54)-C5)-methyltransferase TrmA [Simiduia curdlanivorans]|uniref:tRNA/tmRNA (uracil-C(5))-methyltransferase n=1 Tax=Simiduia curdlanivorans TaxID=1492769 RepID=A0ABV8V9Q3_9GAMM|nr:tRNA (uridine(54)-C5)-methyltransferase TrmA [Simiduia curdlanivorans]MDN3639712.1 tRNA (uridine(54)-C5)-methyltransferase TrmA [Simiduia curdlanivorans]